MSVLSVNGSNDQAAPTRGRSSFIPAANESASHNPTIPESRLPGDSGGDTAALPGQEGDDRRSSRTLLLIDEVRLRRESLACLLSAKLPDFEVLAVAAAQPVEAWTTRSPEVIIVSVPSSGLAQLNELVAAANGAPVLLLTASDNDDDDQPVDQTGVAGRFPTGFGISLLIAAIQIVQAGGRFQIPSQHAATTYRPDSVGRY